jgi:hypothetical protein
MQKLKVAGKDLVVQDEQFKTVREDWNEYEMASGVRNCQMLWIGP